MKTKFLIIITLSFSVLLFTQSTYAECSEQDRDVCIDSDGKFDYDAYEDSFWEPIEIQYSFEKNSTATFEQKKDELGLRGVINATQEDVITMTVPRSIVDAIHRNCDPDEILLLAKYDNANTTSYDNFYQESSLAEQIMNQTHRMVTFKVLPTMSFELIGTFPLGLVDEMHNTCGALNGYKTYYAPPKFQLEHNVEPMKVKCNDELVLLQKYDGSPSCVTEQTKQKLIERGWTLTELKPELEPEDKSNVMKKARELGIDNIMEAVDSEKLTSDEKREYIKIRYEESPNTIPSLNIRIKDFTRNLEFGERPTFTLIETGYAIPCTHPTLEVYLLKQEIGNDHTPDDLVYEDKIVHSCPSFGSFYPVLKFWDETDFKPFPVCEKEGRYLIVGDSGYERGALEEYYCNAPYKN